MIKIETGQYYVVLAEINTGIIVSLDGKRSYSSLNEVPNEIFSSLNEAEQFSQKKISELPDIECNIYNDKSERVKVIVKG